MFSIEVVFPPRYYNNNNNINTNNGYNTGAAVLIEVLKSAYFAVELRQVHASVLNSIVLK